MKTKYLLANLILFLLIYPLAASAQNPTYSLTARNLHLIAPDSLTFDLYLKHTNFPTTFSFAGGQMFLDFNCNFGNGGVLSFRLIESGMDSCCRPSLTTVNQCMIRTTSNLATCGPGGCEISHTGLGTLFGKFSLRTSTSFLPLDSFRLQWRSFLPNPFTKIFAYVGNVNTDISTPNTHFIDLISGINEPTSASVLDFNLYQNYPNPFNPSTRIDYDLSKKDFVSLKIFDINGREVATLVDELVESGRHSAVWNAEGAASGIYFARIMSGSFSEAKRMLLIR